MDSEFDWIKKWAEITPDKLALTDLDSQETFSYRELNQYVDQMFHYLKSQFKEGERIAVLTEQSPFLVALFGACQKLGLVLVPINFRLSSQEVQDLLKDCDPALIIFSEHYEDKVILSKDYFCSLRLIDFIDSVNAYEPKNLDLNYQIKEDSPVFLFYSSGTTSKPKGILYTNKMLFWNSLNTAMQLEITSRDSTINILPPYHTSGWNVFVTPLLHHGGHIAMLKRFEVESLLSHLSAQKVSLFLSLPTMLQMLSNHNDFKATNLSSLRYIITGGEFISQDLIKLWKQEKDVSIRPGYGLTEAGPSITSLHQDMIFKKINSIGKPNFYIEIEIRDTNNQKLPAYKVGELCIKSKVVTPGYWKDKEKTEERIKEGWLKTGDLAYVDEEGFIFLKGRLDDMYISGGENIYPKEVENVLNQHPDVVEAVILPIDDHKWGKVGLAFVKSTNPLLDEDCVRIFLKDKLAKYKYPKYFLFLKEFPVTSFGKISRRDLYRLFKKEFEKI